MRPARSFRQTVHDRVRHAREHRQFQEDHDHADDPARTHARTHARTRAHAHARKKERDVLVSVLASLALSPCSSLAFSSSVALSPSLLSLFSRLLPLLSPSHPLLSPLSPSLLALSLLRLPPPRAYKATMPHPMLNVKMAAMPITKHTVARAPRAPTIHARARARSPPQSAFRLLPLPLLRRAPRVEFFLAESRVDFNAEKSAENGGGNERERGSATYGSR